MSSDPALDGVLAALREVLPSGERATASTPLMDLGLDSIGMVSLIGELEARFAVSIPVEEVLPEHFATAADVAALIGRLRG